MYPVLLVLVILAALEGNMWKKFPPYDFTDIMIVLLVGVLL